MKSIKAPESKRAPETRPAEDLRSNPQVLDSHAQAHFRLRYAGWYQEAENFKTMPLERIPYLQTQLRALRDDPNLPEVLWKIKKQQLYMRDYEYFPNFDAFAKRRFGGVLSVAEIKRLIKKHQDTLTK